MHVFKVKIFIFIQYFLKFSIIWDRTFIGIKKLSFVKKNNLGTGLGMEGLQTTKHPWAPQTDLQSLLIRRMVSKPTFLANQNHLRAACYVCQAPQLILASSKSIFQKQIFSFYIHQKPFFEKFNVIIKFLWNKQFLLKSVLLLVFRLLIYLFFSKFHKFLNLCRTIVALYK